MLKYYTSRRLSEIFGIKLARWKRWSREFLPPDPLGGMQSGYARQYTLDESFIVYLGGYLVKHLQFSIPDTRIILKELNGWMKENGFLGFTENHSPQTLHDQEPLIQKEILIYRRPMDGKPVYCVRKIANRTSVNGKDAGVWDVRYKETLIPPDLDPETIEQALSAKLLLITKLLLEFSRRLEIDATCLPALFVKS